MKATYSAEVDKDGTVLRLRLSGFFSVDDVRAFAKVRNDAMTRLRCAPNQHLTLCDARGSMLSKPEVTAEFQRLLADPAHASRRLAYVVEGALARMQANRILDRPTLAFFEDVGEAERWLFSE